MRNLLGRKMKPIFKKHELRLCWLKLPISRRWRWVRSPRDLLLGLHVWEWSCECKKVWEHLFWITWWSDQGGWIGVCWWFQWSARDNCSSGRDMGHDRAVQLEENRSFWWGARPVERPAVHLFVSFYFSFGFLWALSPFVLGYSNMFHDYIRSLRASLGLCEYS